MKIRAVATLLTLITALSAATQLQAQANAANYAFTTTNTGSLADMSSGTTTLLNANIDDAASPVTLIGFDFYFMGVRQDRFSISDNGVLRFAAGAQTGSPYKPLAQAAVPIITAYGADQRTHAGDGKVHYKLSGVAPNRVASIEWLNNQANFNTGGTADLTYQVSLSETSGCIDFVYGAMTMSTLGAADTNSQNPNIGFSANNTAGTVGSVTAAQSGTPAPTFNGAVAVPVANLYTAGTIPVLTSAAQGTRRTFGFCPPTPSPAIGPLSFTLVAQTTMTLNWGDAPNEAGYAVYNSTDGINFAFAGTAAQNATSFVASSLLPSTSYTWRVFANSEGALSTAIIGVQATTAPTPRTSAATGLWSAPATWSPAGVPTASDLVTIAAGHTVTIDTAAVAYSVTVAGTGTLQYEQTTARTLTSGSDVTVQPGGTLQSNPAGTVTAHVLSLPGNLVNTGTLDFSTNADTAGAGITFTGTSNTSFSGTGAITDVRQITVNKGTSQAAIMELMPSNFTVRGAITDTVVGGWLVMSNGTIKISGTFAGTSRVFAAAAYTIPATFGFWLNNPNYVVAAQAGNAINSGLFRLSQGNFNQGTLASHSMRSGVGAVFTIEEGTYNAAGQFSPQNAVTYNQSGGTMNVGIVGNSQSNFGTFELFSAASTFNMAGGTINIVQASTGATPIDYQNLTANVVAASGTLRTGNGATLTNFNFRLRGSVPNLIVDNTTNNKTATATAQLNLRGTTTISTGTTLVINGQTCLVTGPTFTNNGTLTGTAASTRFYFLGGSGPSTYNGNGVVTAPLTSFEVDNIAGVTLDPAINPLITARFNNFSGGLINAGKLTIGNGGATTATVQLGVAGVTQVVNGFDAPPVFNPGTGGVNLLYAPELSGRTTGNEVPPSRTLNTLGITTLNNITIAGGDIAVNGTTAGALALGASRVITGANALYFNSATGTVTRTSGFVDGNFRKALTAATNTTFEVGSANGYTPVIFNATAGTFPTDVTVAAVQTPAPGIQPLSQVINRHWRLTASGVTANVTFNYLDPTDLPGTVTEAGLQVLRHESGNPANYSNQGGTIDTAANTATINGVSAFSDWTLGMPVADLSITVSDGVTTAAPGASVTYTITASNAGTLANPTAAIADAFPAGLTCSTTCVGSLGATCAAGPFAGDINDIASIPSGGAVTYTSNCAISLAATGTLVNTAAVSGGALADFDAGNNSATDTDTLVASADLAITKTDGVTSIAAGGSTTYTIVASNAGPSSAAGSTVADTFPVSLTCTWTCSGAGGGTCAAGGAGNINDTANLPVGGSVAYVAACTLSASASGTLTNTATVTAAAGINDPSPGNNNATDSDGILESNLIITPGTLDFGNQPIGSGSGDSFVTFANNGAATLVVSGLSVALAPFTRTAAGTCGNSLPFNIAVGTDCTLSYAFSPSVAGSASQGFTVNRNGTGATTFSLTGNGVLVDAVFANGFE